MSRTKNTQYLAIVSALNLLISSIFSIVIGRMILVYLGSEYNGINAIVSQFLMIISVIEGGFTTASMVALMRPYAKGESTEINQIFAETSFKFKKISVLYLLIGVLGAIGYGFVVKTNIKALIVISVLIIGVVSSGFNIGTIAKYRLVFQVAQKEHIFATVTLCFTFVGQLGMIIAIVLTKNIVLMRFVGAVCTILGGIFSIVVFRRIFNIEKVKWDRQSRIHGTKDVLIGKIVGTIHSSSTAIFLSIFSSAAMTSVYAVYNSVIHVITSVANIGFSAPQNAVGQVLQGEDILNKKKVILDYQYIIIIALTMLFVPLSVLIVPFVRIYTQGVTDIQYVDYKLAALLIISTYFQLIHVPAGICVYMSGGFKTAKKIQIIALVILLMGNLMLGNLMGLYGFLISVTICNLFLALFEIAYVHIKLIPKSLGIFLQMWIPNLFVTIILFAICNTFAYLAESIFSWILLGIGITVASIVITIIFNKLFLKEYFDKIKYRFMSVLAKRKYSK